MEVISVVVGDWRIFLEKLCRDKCVVFELYWVVMIGGKCGEWDGEEVFGRDRNFRSLVE